MKQVKFITDKHLKTLIGKKFRIKSSTVIICTCKQILRFKSSLVLLIEEDNSKFFYEDVEFVKRIIQ